jgi:hypothetical protein
MVAFMGLPHHSPRHCDGPVQTYRVVVHRFRVAAAVVTGIVVCIAATTTAAAAPSTPTLDLRVRGIASKSAGAAASGPLVPFSGTLRCGRRADRATGDLAGHATKLCTQARRKTAALLRLNRPNTRLCSQIYSGPEHARITGTVDGTHVDISIARSDGCGTADWQQLEWLLGPPVR